MKSGKKPTRAQMEAISFAGLPADKWLVVKSLSDELHLTHRETGQVKVIAN